MGQSTCVSQFQEPGDGPIDVAFHSTLVDIENENIWEEIDLNSLGNCEGTINLENLSFSIDSESALSYSFEWIEPVTNLKWLGFYCAFYVPNSTGYFWLYQYVNENLVEEGSEIPISDLTSGNIYVYGYYDPDHPKEAELEALKLNFSKTGPTPVPLGDYFFMGETGALQYELIANEFGDLTHASIDTVLVQQNRKASAPSRE